MYTCFGEERIGGQAFKLVDGMHPVEKRKETRKEGRDEWDGWIT